MAPPQFAQVIDINLSARAPSGLLAFFDGCGPLRGYWPADAGYWPPPRLLARVARGWRFALLKAAVKDA